MLMGAAGMAAVLTLPRAASARQATPAAGWSFTDDKGVTVELDAMPERLAMDVNVAAPLWDFGVRPDAVFGWNASETGDFGDAGGNVDPEAVQVAGNASEPVQLEKLAATDPDLIITLSWTPEDPQDYWSIDPEILPQVQDIAPILAMSATGSADANTERFAELAAALGADLETPELAEAKAAYDAALSDLQAAAEEKADLTVLFLSVVPDAIYIANPPDWADLNFYQSLGVNIVKPDVEDGGFWEQLSQEQALKYPADIMMFSTRPEAVPTDEVIQQPTFAAHPAVRAGQVYGWNQDFIQSYQGMTEAMTHLSETLRGAKKVT
jgi:iron complex transport system substrate-binding protein